jgi:hypothetical protein
MRPQPDWQKPERPAIPSWRIYRRWGGNNAYLGLVEAVDKVKAIEKALRTFHITNPEHQKRIVAELRD